MLGPST